MTLGILLLGIAIGLFAGVVIMCLCAMARSKTR
jgi:hypothetical protein